MTETFSIIKLKLIVYIFIFHNNKNYYESIFKINNLYVKILLT
jgi:hypothetical protein